MSYIIPSSAFLITFKDRKKNIAVFVNSITPDNSSFTEEDAIKLAKETAKIEYKHDVFEFISSKRVETDSKNGFVFLSYVESKKKHSSSNHNGGYSGHG